MSENPNYLLCYKGWKNKEFEELYHSISEAMEAGLEYFNEYMPVLHIRGEGKTLWFSDMLKYWKNNNMNITREFDEEELTQETLDYEIKKIRSLLV